MQPGQQPPRSAPTIADDFAAQKKKQTQAVIIGGVLAIIAAAIFGLFASGALRFGATNPQGDALQAKGTPPDPGALQLKATPPDPSLQKTATAPPAPAEMPIDVYNWLKHLEECERRKIEISGDQAAEVTVFIQKNSVLGAGMGLMNPYDQSESGDGDKPPAEYTKGKILDLRPRWDDLIQFFYSYPPPAECQPLANDFGQAVNEIPGMMSDLGAILNDLSGNPDKALQSLTKMQNASYDGVDRYFARADEKLSQICTKYNQHKWFNIASDVGSSGILGKTLGGSLPR